MNLSGRYGWWLFILSGIFVTTLFVLRPVSDPDFWWHLKSGEEMFRISGLLKADPFCFTNDAVATARELLILQGYWPAQLLFYFAYSVGGPWGITALNFVLIFTLYAVLFHFVTRYKLPESSSVLLILMSMGVFFPYYALERPHLFSFLFGLLLIALLDRFRDQRKMSLWLFPLMLVWGNIHGGVIVGIALMSLFSFGVVIQLRSEKKVLLKSLCWIGGGVFFGFLNPSAIYILPELFSMSSGNQLLTKGVIEYQDTLTLFRGGHYWVVCLWLLISLHGIALFCSKRRWFPDYLFYFFLFWSSFSYGRNMAFFAICLLPQTAYYLKELQLNTKWVKCIALIGISIILTGLFMNVSQRKSYVNVGEVSNFYPVELVEFVKKTGIDGRVFNDYDWGGFLLAQLYPETLLFQDNRGLDKKVYEDGLRIRWVSKYPVNGKAEFEYLLQKYGVEFIIQKNISKVGLTEPLMRALLKTSDWVPVYQDDKGYVILKNLPRYREVISEYKIENSVFFYNLLDLYSKKIEVSDNPKMYMGRGELFLYLNNLPAAREDLCFAKQALGGYSYLVQLLNKVSCD